VRGPRRASSPARLADRLAALRKRTSHLRLWASLGAELRGWLAEDGSPTWRPSQDHLWREWIERHGDEDARQLAAEVDAALDDELDRRRAGKAGQGS